MMATHVSNQLYRRIPQGIIIFELSFNIWCMDVRYNAEKKKIGMYYWTPSAVNAISATIGSKYTRIQRYALVEAYNIRIVLMLLQNTRYVVISGARQKDEEWNLEENGGFAIHGYHLFTLPPIY